MGASDTLNFFKDTAGVKLSCAHNHPEQKPGETCILCGAPVPRNEGNNNELGEGTG